MVAPYKDLYIGSQSFEGYANVGEADAWLAASIVASNWQASTDDDKKTKCLVSATRWIDGQQWQGEPVHEFHAFPRSGLENSLGEELPTDEIPTEVNIGCIELANELFVNPTLFTTISKTTAKSLGAGPARIEYFRPESGVQVQTVFPKSVMQWLGKWLSGAGVAGVPVATGTHGDSNVYRGYKFNRGF